MKTVRLLETRSRRVRLAEEDPTWEVVGSAVTATSAAVRIARSLLGDVHQEMMYVILLDARHKVMGAQPVAMGAMNACAVDRAVLFGAILRAGAQAFVICHNHPSGDPTPSRDDVAITRVIKEGAEILGLRLLDHLVVGCGDGLPTVSLAERGLL